MSLFTFPQCLKGPNETLFNGRPGDMPPSWEDIRSFSVRACTDHGDGVESGVSDHAAQFFTVYAFNVWDANEVITDVSTRKMANRIAVMLAVTCREKGLQARGQEAAAEYRRRYPDE